MYNRLNINNGILLEDTTQTSDTVVKKILLGHEAINSTNSITIRTSIIECSVRTMMEISSLRYEVEQTAKIA